MSEEKQIEEMANDLRFLDNLQYNPNYTANYQRAIGLYSLGYRKASEVAREIFEEIERLLSSNQSGSFIDATCEWFDYFDNHLAYDIAELKKKYTEEGK